MMKKGTTAVLLLLILLLMTACGKNTTDSSVKKEYDDPAFLTTSVHLRAEESIVSSSLGFLEAGTKIGILSSGEEWTKVEVEGQTGYVPTEYVKRDGKTPESTGDTKTEEKTSEEGTTESVANGSEGENTDHSETPETTQTAAETSAPYQDPNNGVLTSSGVFDITGLSNKSIPYGNDWEDKDSIGLANGIHYYESLYGKYHALYRIKQENNEKILYLTFDEGYEAGYTPIILDVLKEKNVKAVFFLTKQFYDSDPELIQRMIDEGHTLGNHTCAHPSGGYPNLIETNGLDSFINDFTKLHKLIYDSFGYEMKLFRFPEGEASELTMAILYNYGYTSVFWSYAHRDFVLADQPEVSVTLERCLSHMAPGAIYLLHAVSESNTYALADFIDQARAAGYEFGTFPVAEVTQ